MDWDKYFMTMVYLVSMKSKDASTKIGAVVVDESHSILSTGFNGLCRGVQDDMSGVDPETGVVAGKGYSVSFPNRLVRPEKYHWFEHAERNSIYNAARKGVALLNSVMYTQGVPCSDCARSVIQAGIKTVVVHKKWEETGLYTENQKWVESANRSKRMFFEAGIKLIDWEGDIETNITGLSDGKEMKL